MATASMTPAQATAALDLLTRHQGNISHAASAVGLSRSTFESRVRRARQLLDVKPEPEPSIPDRPPLPPSRPVTSYDEAWAQWQSLIGQTGEHYRRPTPKSTTAERVVVASDFHVPFHNPAALAALLAEDADTLIVGGDLMDFYSVSRYMKYERVDALSELAATQLVVEQLASHFPKVVIVEGNHDRPRFEKALRTALTHMPDVLHVIEWLVSFHATPSFRGPALSPIAAMASRYPNVSIAHTAVGHHSVGWFTQYGDILVSHMEKFSVVPGAVLRKADEYFSDFQNVYGISDWRVILQAHTHAMGWFPWRADKLLVELGAMCRTHGYQLSAQAMGRPQRNGYVTLEQEKGRTRLNSVRPVWLDVA